MEGQKLEIELWQGQATCHNEPYLNGNKWPRQTLISALSPEKYSEGTTFSSHKTCNYHRQSTVGICCAERWTSTSSVGYRGMSLMAWIWDSRRSWRDTCSENSPRHSGTAALALEIVHNTSSSSRNSVGYCSLSAWAFGCGSKHKWAAILWRVAFLEKFQYQPNWAEAGHHNTNVRGLKCFRRDSRLSMLATLDIAKCRNSSKCLNAALCGQQLH